MRKRCNICDKETHTPIFDGENGWLCPDCVDEMKDHFRKIFNIDLCAITGDSGLVISLSDLSKLLGMIHRNITMLRYEINDQDRCIAEAGVGDWSENLC